jgi:hypothetical protein
MVKHIQIIDANTGRQQVLIDGKALPGVDSVLRDSIKVVPLGPASEVRLALIAEKVTVSSTSESLGRGR